MIATLSTLHMLGDLRGGLSILTGWPQSLELGVGSTLVGWFGVLLLVLVLIAVVILDAAVLLFVLRWQRGRFAIRCGIELRNMGNVSDRYRLSVSEPTGMSRLRLGIGGTRLCDGIEAAHGEAAAEKSESASGDSRSKAAATSASEGLRRSQQAIGQMRGLSGTIAQSLNSIGNLLGGTAGAPFRNMAADIRRKQAFVRQAEATPRQAVARAEQAPRRALSGTRSVQRQLSGGRLSTGATAEPADSSAKEMAADAQVGTPKLVGREAGGTTPFIDAGGALAVDLDVMPVKRPRETAELKIVVRSKGLEGVGAPWLIEEMTVVVNRVGWFDHSWPVLVYGVAILLQLLLAWALLSTGIVG